MLANERKISRGTFKHVESELYAYHDTLKEIERLKNDIYHATPQFDNNGGGRSNLPSDPTGSVVSTVLMHRKIAQLETIVQAIKEVYERLPEDKQQLIQTAFWQKPQTLTWEGIARRLHVNRATAIRWRNEIVQAISQILGWR